MIRGALVLTAILGGAGTARAQSYDSRQRVDTTLTLERDGTVSVSIYAGRVNVIGASGSSVRIHGTVERGEMEIKARFGSVSVATDPEVSRGGRADLDVTVPIGTRVVLDGFSTNFAIRGVKGEAKVESLSGDVIVTDAVGRLTIETVSGSIESNRVKGDVRAEAVSGFVKLSDIDGDIETESVSGSVTITGARSRSVRAETVSGPVAYSGTFDPSGNYVFKAHSGRVTLGLPADAGATVSLQTFNGNVDSDFPVTLESGKSRMGHESRFDFKIGDGRSRVVLETFSGDIRIQRSTNRDNRE